MILNQLRRGTPARCVLRQDFGLQQSDPGRHQILADRKARFASDVGQLSDRSANVFCEVCRVVNGLRGVRFGAVGARPGAFNTVRYSEKILERHGISVTTVDLSEILGASRQTYATAMRPSRPSSTRSTATRRPPACPRTS